MKKIILLFILSAFTYFSFAQDLKTYIPEDITFLVRINGSRINNNVNFDDIRSSDMYKDFVFKMLNRKSAEERALVKLFETPDETGMNLKNDMYFYSISDASSDNQVTTVLSINLLNGAKFHEFVKDLFHDDKYMKIKKAVKGTYYIYNNSTLIIWNSEKAFYCNLPNTYDYDYYGKGGGYSKSAIFKRINIISKPLKEKNILSNTKLLNALGVDSDITYIFNSNSLSKTPWLYDELNKQEFVKDSTLLNEQLFKDSYSFSFLNFDNGKIVFSGDQYYGEKLASIINPIFNKKPSAKLAGLMFQTPVTSYISYAFSMSETKKFMDRSFNYNIDTLLVDYIRSSQEDRFESDSVVMKYRKEKDTIDFMVNGPSDEDTYTNIEAITDSGTVYKNNKDVDYSYYDRDSEKYKHESLNWFQLDSLEQRNDTLYQLISVRKDTLAKLTYSSLNIKGEELWSIFNGEFMFLYHAMTSVEKKYKTLELDEEYNYVEVEKTKKIPMPLYSFAATINNDSIFKKYLKMMIDKGFIQKDKNRYLVVLGDMNQYIWVKDSLCVLTNDNNFNPTKRTTTNKSEYEIGNYNRVVSHQSGAFIEVGKILSSSVQYVDDKETADVLEILAKYFDETVYYTDFNNSSNYSSNTQILFNDEKKNSLNSLYEMINEMYVHFTKK